MSAILEFYFRFRSRPFRRNLHVMHQAAEFRPNNSTHCGNMTSYLFFQMAAAATQYYFRFRICWCHCLQKVKMYQCTKFRRHLSIRGWAIITSSSKKQTSAILEYHFRFRSRPVRRNRHVILDQATEYRSNRDTHRGNITSSGWLYARMCAGLCPIRTTFSTRGRVKGWQRSGNFERDRSIFGKIEAGTSPGER